MLSPIAMFKPRLTERINASDVPLYQGASAGENSHCRPSVTPNSSN